MEPSILNKGEREVLQRRTASANEVRKLGIALNVRSCAHVEQSFASGPNGISALNGKAFHSRSLYEIGRYCRRFHEIYEVHTGSASWPGR
jgi:hypothetical protein